MRPWIATKRAQLERHRALMRSYLLVRLELEDWHGVQDAASDIRELDAQLGLLDDAEAE